MDNREARRGGAGGITATMYEQLISPAKGFPGVASQLTHEKVGWLDKEYYSLARSLLEAPRFAITVEAHCFQVAEFIRRFAELERMQPGDPLYGFRVIDLADYCNGLPSDKRIVETLANVYRWQGSERTKIAAAECVGRLRLGLRKASGMFAAPLQSEEPAVRQMAREAIARALEIQKRLGDWAAKLCRELDDLGTETTAEVAGLGDKTAERSGIETRRPAAAGAEPEVEWEFVVQLEKDDREFLARRTARVVGVEDWPGPPREREN
jgi:hypothetical protein